MTLLNYIGECLVAIPSVRTRFAPSPTGYLHVGGARTALFNYLYAKANHGKFILRIEDTDQERSSEVSCQQMIKSLAWLNLEYDEGEGVGGEYGPYRQSERLDLYQSHANILLEEGRAYRCFCSQIELENKKKKMEAMGLPPIYDGKCRNLTPNEIDMAMDANKSFVMRFLCQAEDMVVNDVVQKEVQFQINLIGDFIIIKSDGFPSYNFAVVVDDQLMKISHIIRGVGHLSNTPRQILIYKAFNWTLPTFAHVSEIVGSDKKKLSKRHGATNIMLFKDLGYPYDAFVNYLSLLGWSPKDGKEYLTFSTLPKIFNLKNCSKSPSMFDVFDTKLMGTIDNTMPNLETKEETEAYLLKTSKLNWLSNMTIREQDTAEYLHHLYPFIDDIVKQIGLTKEDIINGDVIEYNNHKGVPISGSRLQSILLHLRVYLDYYYQINIYIHDFLSLECTYTKEAKDVLQGPLTQEILQKFTHALEKIIDFEVNMIKNTITEVSNILEVKKRDFFMTLRSALTGKTYGLELPQYFYLLGYNTSLTRLYKARQYCGNRSV